MQHIQEHFISSAGERKIFYSLWLPDAQPRGVIQISHGMAEYVRRYENFARFMTEQGFAVCGNDHFGHGRSVESEAQLGYIPRGGADILVNDLHILTGILRERFPSLPVILMGHSMGSFVARLYLSRYGRDIDGAVIMGSAGPGQPTGAGKLLARLTAALRGGDYRSPLIDGIAFGSYNKKLGKSVHKFAWLSRDEAVVSAYDADPLCGYVFCADAFHTLFDLLGQVSSKEWPHSVPPHLPMLIVSGGEDPVGNWGKGVRELYHRLRLAGVADVSLKLYPEDRHEILNEPHRDTVMTDILGWIERLDFDRKEKQQ